VTRGGAATRPRPRNADELPAPEIGDRCINYRIPGTGSWGNDEYEIYCIIFTKGDVYERFFTYGPPPDYEL